MIRIAAAAYPLDRFEAWPEVEDKLADWVGRAAGAGADLVVFPEYAAMELASLAGAAVAGDLVLSAGAVSERIADLDALHRRLSEAHSVHICSGTGPVRLDDGRIVNRARLIAPSGGTGVQDKLILTPYERTAWRLDPGDGLRVFETALGRIGILVCYDAEFPLLARALIEAGAEILLVPSATDTLAGFRRVRIAAMARALEGQCIVVQAPLVGAAAWSPAVDISHGTAAVFAPPDIGFPDTGVLAEGELDAPGWVFAEVSVARIGAVRRHGQVRNHVHWGDQDDRLSEVGTVPLG